VCLEQREALKAAVPLAAAHALKAVDASFCQVRACPPLLSQFTQVLYRVPRNRVPPTALRVPWKKIESRGPCSSFPQLLTRRPCA